MNNNFMGMIQMFQSKANPKQAFIQMLQSSPQYQTQIQAVQNSANGASMEQIVRQIAKQQGVSEDQIMQAYNSLANKR